MHLTKMDRQFWTNPKIEELEQVTVLICQNQTPVRTRLCIESLLTFYPTIKILVVTSQVKDESYWYLKYKEARNPNIKIFERGGNQNHGDAMHDGIMGYVKTRYVLTMDSDTITKRGGWIELMVHEIAREGVFSIGTLNLTTWSNDCIGNPKNDADIVKYTHPSCSMYDREIYLDLSADRQLVPDAHGVTVRPQFCNHGAPCWSIMKACKLKGYEILGFPIEDYVMHLSGYSWTGPTVVWHDDNNVFVRPLVTFISTKFIDQWENDYDIVRPGVHTVGYFVSFNRDSTNALPYKVANDLFSIRLKVTGDYICIVGDLEVPLDIVTQLRMEVIKWPDRLAIEIEGFVFYTREYFQSNIAWS
jgi:hypothetical protein